MTSIRRNLSEAAANDAQAAHWMQRSAEAEAMEGAFYPACKGGPCKQGRRICPTPEACRIPEAEIADRSWRWAHRIVFAIAVACALLAIAGMFAGPKP
jgi:hypothetical protein